MDREASAISVRGELTDEWKARGVAEGKEYSILTAEIARATFGVTPAEHSQLKGLDVVKTGNTLRDGLFRIIQSIPSPKAEPFKRWLAQVGYERVKEIENPASQGQSRHE